MKSLRKFKLRLIEALVRDLGADEKLLMIVHHTIVAAQNWFLCTPGDVFFHVCSSMYIQHPSLIVYQTFSILFHLEYDKLWAAVTGGRGAGRGKKKVIVKGVDPELLKYGKCWVAWQNRILSAMLPALISFPHSKEIFLYLDEFYTTYSYFLAQYSRLHQANFQSILGW